MRLQQTADARCLQSAVDDKLILNNNLLPLLLSFQDKIKLKTILDMKVFISKV